ncbi:MAG: extracellular solute-binding protein, partial [Propionibacteriaceae bacterium]
MRFSLPRRRATRLTAGLAAASLAVVPLAACTTDGSGAGTAPGGTVTINVALAANPQMKTAESLISDFEAKNPGIKVKFTTLPENDLRPAVTKDVATNAGQFDVAMVGAYEVPIWAQKGWLVPLDDYVAKDTAWDAADLTTPIKDVVSGQDG